MAYVCLIKLLELVLLVNLFQVDGDRRNSLPPVGQDSLAAVGAHAALLSAANAGAGYTAFA